MAGRPARLRFRNAPNVTMTNVHNFTRTVRYNGDIEVDPAKLAVTGAEPTYLNYDWVLEDGATLLAGKTMTVAGDINFSAAQTLEELVTFQKGLEIDTVGMLVSAGGIEAVNNNIEATAGAISAGTTVTAAGNIESTLGNIRTFTGNITCGGNISAGGNVTSGGNFNVNAGGILVSAGDVVAHGPVEAAANNIVASGAGNGAVEATAGSITAVTGDVTATTGGVAITGSGDLQVDLGNITASTNVTAGGSIEADTTVLGTAALAVDDVATPAVTHTITGDAGGDLIWDALALTVGGADVNRFACYRGIHVLAASGTVDIIDYAIPAQTYYNVEILLNGTVTGDVGSADIGKVYSVRIIAAGINDAGGIAALNLDTVVIANGGLAGTTPVFTVDNNGGAGFRVRCANGDDGVPVDNQIVWRGEAYITETVIP